MPQRETDDLSCYGYTFFSFPLLVFFFLGVQCIGRMRPAGSWSLILTLIAAKTLIHLPYYIVNRFREAVSPLLMVVAMLGFFSWLESRRCASS